MFAKTLKSLLYGSKLQKNMEVTYDITQVNLHSFPTKFPKCVNREVGQLELFWLASRPVLMCTPRLTWPQSLKGHKTWPGYIKTDQSKSLLQLHCTQIFKWTWPLCLSHVTDMHPTSAWLHAPLPLQAHTHTHWPKWPLTSGTASVVVSWIFWHCHWYIVHAVHICLYLWKYCIDFHNPTTKMTSMPKIAIPNRPTCMGIVMNSRNSQFFDHLGVGVF